MLRPRWTLVLALALVVPLGHGSVARASFPGTKGKILFQDFVAEEGHIFVANPDGTGVRDLTPNETSNGVSSPSWSPDGRTIVFVRDYPSAGLWLMNGDGAHQPHHPRSLVAGGGMMGEGERSGGG